MTNPSLHFLIHSEAGYEHRNEDMVIVRPHPQNADALLCALADGQGGQSGGGEASLAAVEACLRTASVLPVRHLLTEEAWYEIVAAADEAVADMSDAGYTTLVCLCVTLEKVCGASCGDSASLLVNETRSLFLTEGQRRNPPIGSRAAYPVAFAAQPVGDWKLLLLSDGVWRYIGLESVADLSRRTDGPETITALRQLQTKQNGGRLPDDFSFALVQPTIS